MECFNQYPLASNSIQYIIKSNNYVVNKYQVPLWMSEWKKFDRYEMVKPKNKIELF
jgi:hypothetical protein